MAQTRLEKIGTIFTRVTGLMKAGSMKKSERPLWYDVYEAFPPKVEPRFDRPVKVVPVKPIFYPEDAIRARFQREFGAPGVLRLRDPTAAASLCERVVERCAELGRAAPQLSQDELFEAAVDALRGEGVSLGGPVASPVENTPQASAPQLNVSELFADSEPAKDR